MVVIEACAIKTALYCVVKFSVTYPDTPYSKMAINLVFFCLLKNEPEIFFRTSSLKKREQSPFKISFFFLPFLRCPNKSAYNKATKNRKYLKPNMVFENTKFSI